MSNKNNSQNNHKQENPNDENVDKHVVQHISTFQFNSTIRSLWFRIKLNLPEHLVSYCST